MVLKIGLSGDELRLRNSNFILERNLLYQILTTVCLVKNYTDWLSVKDKDGDGFNIIRQWSVSL